MTQRVVIVGGGVIGTACGHYLNQADFDVTIVDRKTIGGACSHGNCGYICPSHVLPLTVPGAVRGALKAMLGRNSPFAIRPRFDRHLWSWLLQFAFRCRREPMLRAAHALHSLLQLSNALYEPLLTKDVLDVEWERQGLLFVFQTAKGFEHHREADLLLRHEFGLGADVYPGDAVRELEPALLPGLAGGWHYPLDSHLRPDRLLSQWRRLLEQRGVVFVENAELMGFEQENGVVREVETAQGRFAADQVVVATGAWTPLLARGLGIRFPIEPGKGYSLTMPRPARSPKIPLIFDEHRVAITPMQSGYRIGSTMEFAGYDTTLSPRRLDLLRKSARLYLHEPEAAPILETWYGWRPMTYDSLPIIGPCPNWKNVTMAVGHNMLGLSQATGTGKVVRDLLVGDPPPIPLAPFSPGRFFRR